MSGTNIPTTIRRIAMKGIFNTKAARRRNYFNLLLTIAVSLGIGLACTGTKAEDSKTTTTKLPAKVAEEKIRSFRFVYFKIPAGLGEKELIDTARELHDSEPDAQLILVDDDSQLDKYITYTKEWSNGNYEAELPKEWMEKHVVANVQKYMSGKFVLCKGAGYKEIADLK